VFPLRNFENFSILDSLISFKKKFFSFEILKIFKNFKKFFSNDSSLSLKKKSISPVKNQKPNSTISTIKKIIYFIFPKKSKENKKFTLPSKENIKKPPPKQVSTPKKVNKIPLKENKKFTLPSKENIKKPPPKQVSTPKKVNEIPLENTVKLKTQNKTPSSDPKTEYITSLNFSPQINPKLKASKYFYNKRKYNISKKTRDTIDQFLTTENNDLKINWKEILPTKWYTILNTEKNNKNNNDVSVLGVLEFFTTKENLRIAFQKAYKNKEKDAPSLKELSFKKICKIAKILAQLIYPPTKSSALESLYAISYKTARDNILDAILDENSHLKDFLKINGFAIYLKAFARDTYINVKKLEKVEKELVELSKEYEKLKSNLKETLRKRQMYEKKLKRRSKNLKEKPSEKDFLEKEIRRYSRKKALHQQKENEFKKQLNQFLEKFNERLKEQKKYEKELENYEKKLKPLFDKTDSLNRAMKNLKDDEKKNFNREKYFSKKDSDNLFKTLLYQP
jgi:hypothetical protein